jgi:hypothetical protein
MSVTAGYQQITPAIRCAESTMLSVLKRVTKHLPE